MPFDASNIRHVVFDMDGTIYRGLRLFDCTMPFLERLLALGIGYTFLTNNSSRSKSAYIEKLRKFGIEADEEQIYTSADRAVAYLREQLPKVKRLAVLGHRRPCEQMSGEGFEVGWEAPVAFVVGFDTSLTYDNLCRAAFWFSQGLPFIATHPDLTCPTDEPAPVLVDCGAICACLTAATGRQPMVLGKPRPFHFAQFVLPLETASAAAGDGG